MHSINRPFAVGSLVLLVAIAAPRDLLVAQRPAPSTPDSSMKGMPGMEAPPHHMPSTRGADTAHDAMTGMRRGRKAHEMAMADPLGVPMDRMGSGTTWIPDAVSLPSRHFMAGSWEVMVHGFAFAQEDVQGGGRGTSQFGSLNWGMLMGSRPLAGGRFQARTMLSLDPLTVTNRGYPLLLQSGETYAGEPLHDRQHPHDALMELGVLYERPVSSRLGLSVYIAPSGEPALGPVAFMHRPSAMDVPTAPISHHWQDATHISFGVVTAGLFGPQWKLEGSVFNGREPDENRWNVDPIRLDSYSGRLTLNPSSEWSFSGGYGYMRSPEALHPTESMHRITASAMHGAKLGKEGQWASTFVWGANSHGSGAGLTHSVVLETEAILRRENTLFGRAEWVQKTAEDLVLDGPPTSFAADRRFNVGALSVGMIRDFAGWTGATLGVGIMGTMNVVPSALEPVYGSRTPLGVLLFLRLRPLHQTEMRMDGM